jgi:predicted methyltransferase
MVRSPTWTQNPAMNDLVTRRLRSLSILSALSVLILGCASSVAPGSSPTEATEKPAQAESAPPKVESRGPSQPTPEQAIANAISASSRSDADRALDAGRHPSELLQFFQIGPGQKVAELAAGGGYTAELVARVVGPTGLVWGQNSPFILNRFAEKPWTERLTLPWMSNVKRVDAEFDSPLPRSANDLDAVLFILFYHDTVWMKTDRTRMNAAIFQALRPGGVYGVVDHSAREGTGLADVETLHRIEQSIVTHEVEAAGFVLEAEADFLRNPGDTRDWSASPRVVGERRGTSDRFVLRFRKPLASACGAPRPTECSEFPEPVCAQVDTGIRCIKAPCDSSENKTFKNACQACREPNVLNYERGACAAK